VYNRALTENQLQQVMSGDAGNDPGLVYHFIKSAAGSATAGQDVVQVVEEQPITTQVASSPDESSSAVSEQSANNTYQAENSSFQSKTRTRIDGNWWTGGGFKDMFRSPRSFVEWNNVTTQEASTVTLKFTYTNGDSFNRPCLVYVNGVVVGTVGFATTGDWSVVGTESINVALNAGENNTVRLQSASTYGGPDLDKMTVTLSQSAQGGQLADGSGDNIVEQPAQTPIQETSQPEQAISVASGQPTANIYQAENNSLQSRTRTRADGSWWTGSGFKDMFRSPRSLVEWNTVTSVEGPNVTLEFTYTNGDGFNRPCRVYVNGVAVGTVNFATTGDWSVVGTESINVTLNAGENNTIRLQSASAYGGPDLDKMTVAIAQSVQDGLIVDTGQQATTLEQDNNQSEGAVVVSVTEQSLPATSAPRNILDMIQIGFEQPDLVSNGLNVSGNPPKLVSNSHPVFEGNQSLSIFIDREQSPVEYRTEFTLSGNKFDRKFINFEYGKEYWIGFAIYLNDDYQLPELNDIIFQTHGIPDFNLGENYRNPILSMSVTGLLENDKNAVSEPHWAISILGDHRAVTPDSGVRYPTHVRDVISPVQGDIGRWVTWVIRYKNTYNPDGYIDIWKDGQHVYSKTGIRTAFNDRKGAYIKMGSYKWSWRSQHTYPTINPARRQSYLDSVRIAQGQDRYNDVAP